MPRTSEPSVRYRAQQLEGSGTIQIVGIANPLSISFDRLALIGVRCKPGTAKKVCKEMAELTESRCVVLTTGSYNVMVEVVCRDLSRYTELLHDRLQMIDGGTSTESFFALKRPGWHIAGALGRRQLSSHSPTRLRLAQATSLGRPR